MKFSQCCKTITLFILTSCVGKIYAPQPPLNTPAKINLYPADKKIIVKFYAYNLEENFKGYNVYICENEFTTTSGLTPVKNETSDLPTIKWGSANCYSDGSGMNYFEITNCNGNPLTNWKTYYVGVTAYAIEDEEVYESSLSPVESISPVYEGKFELMNKYFSTSNYGLKFYSDGSVKFSSTNDFIFILKQVSSDIIPYFLPQNNSQIQDKGYVDSIHSVNSRPSHGYLNNPVICRENHIYFVKTASSKIAYFFVEEIIPAGNTTNSDWRIKISWAY